MERQARAVRVQRADAEKAAAEARSERLAAGATQREAPAVPSSPATMTDVLHSTCNISGLIVGTGTTMAQLVTA